MKTLTIRASRIILIFCSVIAVCDISYGAEISISDATVVEGDAGQRTVEITVNLVPPSVKPITVAYSTVSGTAGAGSDFAAATGTLTFAPGETAKRISVAITGDKSCEMDENFKLSLTNPTGATLGNAQSTVTIVNDDFNACPGGRGTGGTNTRSLSVYEVQMTFTGFLGGFAGASGCPVRTNGKVVITGIVSGDENVKDDDNVNYTGIVQMDADVDLCEAMRLPNGEDKLCSIVVKGSGPMKTELDLEADGRGGYIKLANQPGATIVPNIGGTCDATLIAGERALFPEKSEAVAFNGTELPLPAKLHAGLVVRDNRVVFEVLRVIRP